MVQWHQNPSLIPQLKALSGERDDLRSKNLFEADDIRPAEDPKETPPEEAVRARTPDGTWNDLGCKHMGAKGTGFGRNAPIARTAPDLKRLLDPDPRGSSRTLMAGAARKPAGIINALAAPWLQFETHKRL